MDDLTPADEPKASLSHRRSVFLLAPLSVLLIAVLWVFYVTYTTAVIIGPSMEPTLISGERVLLSRGYETASRGDVVVIRPSDRPEEDALVKRVVAVPGDQVYIVEGRLEVNGSAEQGDHTVYVAEGDIGAQRTTIADGYVYVLGDNRPVSQDSRIFGPVRIADIEGRVALVIRPLAVARRVD